MRNEVSIKNCCKQEEMSGPCKCKVGRQQTEATMEWHINMATINRRSNENLRTVEALRRRRTTITTTVFNYGKCTSCDEANRPVSKSKTKLSLEFHEAPRYKDVWGNESIVPCILKTHKQLQVTEGKEPHWIEDEVGPRHWLPSTFSISPQTI